MLSPALSWLSGGNDVVVVMAAAAQPFTPRRDHVTYETTTNVTIDILSFVTQWNAPQCWYTYYDNVAREDETMPNMPIDIFKVDTHFPIHNGIVVRIQTLRIINFLITTIKLVN